MWCPILRSLAETTTLSPRLIDLINSESLSPAFTNTGITAAFTGVFFLAAVRTRDKESLYTMAITA